MDKIAKIRSQAAKYNVFCRTEANGKVFMEGNVAQCNVIFVGMSL